TRGVVFAITLALLRITFSTWSHGWRQLVDIKVGMALITRIKRCSGLPSILFLHQVNLKRPCTKNEDTAVVQVPPNSYMAAARKEAEMVMFGAIRGVIGSSYRVIGRHPLALRLLRNTKLKAHPKHIDWGKLIATNEIMHGYVIPIYGNKNFLEDDSWIDIIMDDVYDTFYRDEEEEAKVAKASEGMKLSIMKEKFLAMVKSEKARVKDYTNIVVTDGMVDYVFEKYGNKWKSEDEVAYVILEDLWL
nr:hypothetical protein [Tanacetum cinerariifolium]